MTYITRAEAVKKLGTSNVYFSILARKFKLTKIPQMYIFEEIEAVANRKRIRRCMTPEQKLARKVAKAKEFIASVEQGGQNNSLN